MVTGRWWGAGLAAGAAVLGLFSGCGDDPGGSGLFIDPDAAADAAGGPCETSADCPASAAICDPSSSTCVECLLDGHCGADESCQSRRCVGDTSCESSLDCDASSPTPICDPAVGKCVECTIPEDCDGTADCVANRCEAFTSCTSSLDCDSGQVCDTVLERCVECVTSDDCSGDDICINSRCVEITPCVSDKDCRDLMKLCDKSLGYCVACTSNAQCADVQHCSLGDCVLDVCVQGKSTCSNGAVAGCNDDGSALLPDAPCGARTTCVQSATSATCEPWACTAGQTECQGDDLVECSDDGLTVENRTDCTGTGQRCVSGACADAVCSPNAVFCDGKELKLCDASGQSASTLQLCGSSEFCDGTLGTCRAQVCTPSAKACNGDVATTCNASGSGYAPGGTDCAGQGKSCAAGECVACPGGRGPVRDLRLMELFAGTYDWVVIENRGTCTVDLLGVRFSARTSTSGNDLDFDLPAHVLAPGARVYVVDSSGAQAGDISSANNIFFTDTSSDYAMLCDGVCTSSTIIDLVAHVAGATPLPPYPTGVTFSPGGLAGITASNVETHALRRRAFSGTAPSFLASDWEVAAKSRAGGTQCPVTQPVNGASCTELGANCTYGGVTCSCFLTWSCS